ncbi:MAG: bifunctional 4-hydroxy-3-methylbut-2-enyl diphosphate reductase/30S ribosomal protein S1 [Oscillospiraceae bacterium]|nr:bifunctional 4-hydroxy-3-methylbut-2-enyl diphosphate reductase/30S ribosomal protein S1 [Oscillospiraceae bacterium]
MRVIVAESAGFCFGVRRAVSICEKAAEEYGECVTLGPVIHNSHVIKDLEEKGVRTVLDISEIDPSVPVIIRCHGLGKNECERLTTLGARIIDATCPDVKKIQHIVETESGLGRTVLIIGERTHPEIIAISGWCENCEVFETPEELSAWLKSGNNAQKDVSVVFQTTGTQTIYRSCAQIIKKECTNPKIFDTICNATFKRQEEAIKLSKIADVMIVVGGKNSANSLRLADICREYCKKVIFTEDAVGLDIKHFHMAGTVGVTAGASTPEWIIKEVTQKMSEEIKIDETLEAREATIPEAPPVQEEVLQANIAQDAAPEAPESKSAETDEAPAAPSDEEGQSDAPETFEEMLEKSIKTLHTGQKVTGIVTSITATEVSVDLGTKQSGYIPVSELTDDPNADINEIVKVGDTIETFVMRVNDVEGMVMLSKKRLDAIKGWDDIEVARANRAIVEGIVTEENKGGIVVSVRGVRVFVPASQTGLPKSSPMTELVKKTVKLRITEVNQSKRRVVGSIRAVTFEERKEKAEKLWNEIEVGKEYDGVVKSMTSYGVFVDIGGVDGMVHISELSWTRIKQPSDVVAVGDEIRVYVISFDKETRKISLGFRKAEDNPWARFTAQNQPGDVVNVKIVKMMPFGAFAEIYPGVDGLIHISQIADHRIGLPSEVLSEGQLVDVKITDIDHDRKKVSLSIKAVNEPEGISADAEDRTPEVVYDTDAPPLSEDENTAEAESELVVETQPETHIEDSAPAVVADAVPIGEDENTAEAEAEPEVDA